MAQQKEQDNCTYDGCTVFVKQASVWVAGAVWLKEQKNKNKTKNTAIFKAPSF